jgi:hypothetical protein
MEFIKPTTIIVPKEFVDFLGELEEFASKTGEDMLCLLGDIESEETEYSDYIKFEYKE